MIRKASAIKTAAPLLVLELLALAGPVSAAGPGNKNQASVNAQLARSEARIQALQQRIDELEKRLNSLQPDNVAVTGTSPPAAVPPGAATRSPRSAPPPPSAQAAPPAPGPARAALGRGLGSFEVDEAAAQRALERTLTQTGALLLPRGTVELTPSLGYTRGEITSAALARLTDPVTGATGIGLVSQRARTSTLSANVGLRIGLPMESQFEASLPFNHVRTSRSDGLGGEQSDSANGAGDLTLGVAKTFLREEGIRPDLLGRLSYNFGTGRRQSGLVTFNGGYRQLQAEVVALKRQDPLAFTAGVFYTRPFEEDSLRPGDAYGFSLGAALAASPATSLQLGFSQIHRNKQELNGAGIAGTSQTYGVFNLGASSVLSRDTTLVTQVGIGLGSDAPDYSILIALPILFR